MSEFEFLRAFAGGHYLPTGSIIHRLDPRARLLAGTALLLTLALTQRWRGLLVGLGAALVGLTLARISLRYALRGLLTPLPFIVILSLFQLFLAPHAPAAVPLWALGPVRIYAAGVGAAGLLILRFAALILLLSLWTFCLSSSELVRGLETLFRPLTALGLPTQDLVLAVQATLHFMPLLAREAERIAKAQASRGAEWGTGRGGLLRRARQMLPILLPLFLTALQRAETLALAMEARGYRGRGRTSMVELRWRWADSVTLLVALAASGAVVWI